MSSTKVSDPTHRAGRRTPVLASRPLLAYRTIDLMTAAVLGVAFGFVFWAWGVLYQGPAEALQGVYAPLSGLLSGPWLLAGVVAGLLIRRPGAAFMAEVLAAVVSAVLGSAWGWTVLLSGALQGLGVELVLAVFLYRRFSATVAVLGGVLAATAEVVGYEWHEYYADWTWEFKLAYLGFFALSGAVVAGLGGAALVRLLAKTGAVRALPAGQEELERSAH